MRSKSRASTIRYPLLSLRKSDRQSIGIDESNTFGKNTYSSTETVAAARYS